MWFNCFANFGRFTIYESVTFYKQLVPTYMELQYRFQCVTFFYMGRCYATGDGSPKYARGTPGCQRDPDKSVCGGGHLEKRPGGRLEARAACTGSYCTLPKKVTHSDGTLNAGSEGGGVE